MSHPKMSGLPVPPTHPNSTGKEGAWHELPWKRFEQVVFRLQKRIYQAKQRGEERTARKLQTLLIQSRSARFLAVRRVSQLNSGKKTAGIDGKANLTHQERYQLMERLKLAAEWNHQGLREVPIPKADGTQRILKIPTLQDRAWQTLIAMALEPCAEVTFHARAYGFRPGRSCWDAQKVIWLNTHRGPSGKKFSGKVYELDIKACFDRINRQDLIKRVELPKSYKASIWRALQAGTNPEYPDQGAPQGGPLTPPTIEQNCR